MATGKKSKLDKPRSSTVTWSQFLVIMLITIALAVVLEYGHRATVNAGLQRENQQLEQDVATLEAEYRALQVERDRVQTDAYVEEWARTEGVMVLQGETPVVPLPGGQTAPQEEVTPAPAPEPAGTPADRSGETASHWPEWWALFFGPDPATEGGTE